MPRFRFSDKLAGDRERHSPSYLHVLATLAILALAGCSSAPPPGGAQ